MLGPQVSGGGVRLREWNRVWRHSAGARELSGRRQRERPAAASGRSGPCEEGTGGQAAAAREKPPERQECDNPQAWRGREDAPRPWKTFSFKHLPPSERPRPSGQQCLSAIHATGHLIPLPSPSKTGPRSPDPMAGARGAQERLAHAQPCSSRLGSVPLRPRALHLRNEEMKGTVGAFSTRGESIL
ncbi:unnamed protein product [Rangifer tarandus platyrhynchus]|uniref:Uncharacterized protein n=2 Tax=Rangifer tarandus platyrhynchus TaxID=3082113 RepID=A0ACB0E568_RANTA|nr:unnamed protein product [Rangifer tarandus platyrhynchus]CAI9695569.1 unnamed protein product [Rangifer tarandus platyrhynchus]